MVNAFKLTSKVATNTMLLLLKNNLVWGRSTSKKFTDKFGNKSEQIGQTLTIRRNQEFIVSDGATFVNQDIVTGSSSVTIDKQKHVGYTWQPTERELSVDDLLNNSILKAKMAQLAQQIESDIADTAKEFASWVGTPGQTVNSATDFLQAPQRLDEFAVPMTDRTGILPPADFYATGGSFTTQTFFGNSINDQALINMKLPMIGNVQPIMGQTTLAITTGDRVDGTVDGAGQNVNYSDVKDGYSQVFNVAGLGANATVSKGEVFTVALVNAVNPRTKVDLGFLQEFVVLADAVADGTGDAALTIANPMIIPSGADEVLRTNTAFQTINLAPGTGAAVVWKGAASTAFNISCVFQRDALQVAFVEPARPHSGEFSYATDPETGITIRNWAFSDGNSDTHQYRTDVIYGITNYDRRLGTKLSGLA